VLCINQQVAAAAAAAAAESRTSFVIVVCVIAVVVLTVLVSAFAITSAVKVGRHDPHLPVSTSFCSRDTSQLLARHSTDDDDTTSVHPADRQSALEQGTASQS